MQVWSSQKSENGPKLPIRIVCDHVTSNQFEFTILVHLNSSNWTKPAYSKSLNMDQTCVFDENLSRDQKFRRESQWTKLVTACICCHVMEEVVDQTWDPRVIHFLYQSDSIFRPFCFINGFVESDSKLNSKNLSRLFNFSSR